MTTNGSSREGRFPDFFVVGGQKCGTTLVYGLLRQHPEVFLPEQKELHYFATRGKPFAFTDNASERLNALAVYREEDYRSRYEEVGGRTAGEVCPTYLYSPHAARAIAAVRPDARIVAILRDPVERSFSAYRHMRARNAEPASSMGAALDAEDDHIAGNWQAMSHYLAGSRYSEQLQRYYDHFDADQILIIPFEQLKSAPLRWVDRICSHIGVSPLPPSVAIAQTNKTYQIDNKLALALSDKKSPLAKLARQLLPARFRGQLRERFLELFARDEDQLSAETRQRMVLALRDDARNTRRISGLAFDEWTV